MSVENTEEQLAAQFAGATPTPAEPVRLNIQNDPEPVAQSTVPQPAPVGPVDANGPILPEPEAPAAPPAEEKPEHLPDLDVIVPDLENLVIAGIPVTINRLKSREFFKLIRVFTNGLGSSFDMFNIDTSDRKELVATISAMAVFAIPNALEEFIDFAAEICKPQTPSDAGALALVMHNPDPDDLLWVIAAMARQEADDFVSLVKKAQAAIKMMPQRVARPTGR